MDAQQQQIQTLFQRLGNAYSSLTRSGRANQIQRNDPLWTFINEVGQVIQTYSTFPKQAAQALDDARHLISLATWLDEAGAHAMADVVDEAATMVSRAASPYTHFYHFYYLVKSLFKSFQTVVMGSSTKELDQQWLQNFGREWQRLLQKYSRFVEMPRYKYSRHAALNERMVVFAQELDERGEYARADLMDRAANYVRRFAEEEKPAIKPMNETPLSTRYCPDHVGVQTTRISDSTVQCPLDGRTYNYESGYSDYEGQRVPGGSVAAQTPDVTPYGVPNRLYDSRQTVINTMN